jgi:hypothetical protein
MDTIAENTHRVTVGYHLAIQDIHIDVCISDRESIDDLTSKDPRNAGGSVCVRVLSNEIIPAFNRRATVVEGEYRADVFTRCFKHVARAPLVP